MIAVALLAGATGAVLRFLLAHVLHSPWSVLVVNVIGSFIAGFVTASVSGDLRLILVTGFCGGLTTFSTLTVETVQLAIDRKWGRAAWSIGANLVLGIAAAAAGFATAATFSGGS